MKIPPWIEKTFHLSIDSFYAIRSQPPPNIERLKNCKIVSHRGQHNNKTIYENTFPAFDPIVKQNIWGIELDIRWTKDLHPVVFHDESLNRLFQSNKKIDQLTLAELKSEFPLIPSLAELVQRYKQKCHLMIEIKKEIYPDPDYQNEVLKNIFSELQPQKDYHLMSLTPDMFDLIHFAPKQCFLPIAELKIKHFSQLSIQQKYAGLTGHYFLLNNTVISPHIQSQQKIGTGFIRSQNTLFRELNRGVEWIFSNHALELNNIITTKIKAIVGN